MNLLADALKWLFSPERLEGQYALPVLLGQHLWFTVLSVVIAALISVPIGWLIGHTGRGREIAVAFTGAARALPSFGLLILLVLVFGVVRTPLAAIVTFALLAIPPLLAGAYTGFEAIDRRVIDAARAMGMTEWQILWRVEVPLGLPLLMAGLRAAVLQVIATVTIAAYVNLGGLGWPIIQGIPLSRFDQVLAGAILVALLALAADLLLALAQRASVPRGVRAARTTPAPTNNGKQPRDRNTPTNTPAAAPAP